MSDTENTATEKPKVPLAFREPKEAAPGEERNNPLGALVLIGLLAMLWFWAGPRYFIVAMGLLLMIFLHELGHFMTARWTGMKATQFFLGFGPRIWSFRRGEVEYGIRAIPAGAFVRILGMNNLDPVEDPADAPRAYSAATYPRRMLVITAGSMMHFLQAMVLFVVLIAGVGVADPAAPGWTVSEISMLDDGQTPSVEAGIELGDRVLSVDGINAEYFDDFRNYLVAHPGDEVTL
ncbi:MAG: site-2 protease family protein [Acidimicrobiales bacterium]